MDNSGSLVSIIIPTLNRANFLPETLDSVLGQTYKNWECIIVDDGSTDNSLEVIQQYVDRDPRFKLYKRPENYKPGANGARNYGFDLSKGEYIHWFDSDDIMLENFLSDKMEVFIKNPEYSSVFSRVAFFKGQRNNVLKYKKQWNPVKNISMYENYVMRHLHIMTQCIMFKKSFLIEINEKFDESIKRLQDADFMNRILIKHPHKSYFIDQSLALVRTFYKDSISDKWRKEYSFEMSESTYSVQAILVELLIQNNKLTNVLIPYLYNRHKGYLLIAYNHAQYELALNYKNLIEKYLRHNNHIFTFIRFRVGFNLMHLFKVDNFFLHYKHNRFFHLFYLLFTRNIKWIYKTLFVRGWLSEKLKNKNNQHISQQKNVLWCDNEQP